MSLSIFSEEIASLKKEWQREITLKKKELIDGISSSETNQTRRMDVARRLFYLGYRAEKMGNLQLAVQQYRLATLLECEVENNILSNINNKDLADLGSSYQDKSNDKCISNLQTEQQFSLLLALPQELLILIVRWVVGSELDMFSLESLSQVCVKLSSVVFNDQEIWHRICKRLNLFSTDEFSELDWRQVWLNKPHLLFHGCYIGKISYVRKGDPGSLPIFGDSSAVAAVQLVQYCRAFRFLSNQTNNGVCSGCVAMVTSACPPSDIVRLMSISETSEFNTNDSRDSGLLLGQYCINSDKIHLTFNRTYQPYITHKRIGRRNVNNNVDEISYQLLSIELEIKSLSKYPKNTVLLWRSYNITHTRRNETTVSSINIRDKNQFPSLVFSPVRSYSLIPSCQPV